MPHVSNNERLTMRELLTLARERLGPAASSLKTRDELLRALEAPAPEAPAPAPEARPVSVVVTRDFFVKRR